MVLRYSHGASSLHVPSIHRGGNHMQQVPWAAGLEELQSLDVLDVHHNRIVSTAPLSQLTSLRILNISSTCISCLSDLSPLRALAELNVRRNELTSLHFADDCGSVDQPLSEDGTHEDAADSDEGQGNEGIHHTADSERRTTQGGCNASQTNQTPEGAPHAYFWLLILTEGGFGPCLKRITVVVT